MVGHKRTWTNTPLSALSETGGDPLPLPARGERRPSEPHLVFSPGGWSPPEGSTPAWGWMPPGGAVLRWDLLPRWVRAALAIPLLDRLLYPWAWRHGFWEVERPTRR